LRTDTQKFRKLIFNRSFIANTVYVHRPCCSLNLCAVSQPPEGASVKLLPIRWLARGVAVAYCACGAYTVFGFTYLIFVLNCITRNYKNYASHCSELSELHQQPVDDVIRPTLIWKLL